MKRFLLIAVLCFAYQIHSFAQQTAIQYELNGRMDNGSIEKSPDSSSNPFAQFIGEWTLKDDTWIQNWGGSDDTIKIPHHHTLCSQINTDNSLLSIIDGPEPNGHIFWSYNPNTKEVGYLSSFGDIRAGVGSGSFYDDNNLRLKVSFEGEAPGTYRIYTYEWINEDEYALKSIQHDANGQLTGLFYQGTFVRLPLNPSPIEAEVAAVLSVLDDNDILKSEQLKVYADDLVHMAPKHPAITNKTDLLAYLEEQATYGYSEMEHQALEIEEHGEVVIVRGQVIGVFHPAKGGETFPFKTKNILILKREQGELKIAKVIYNME